MNVEHVFPIEGDAAPAYSPTPAARIAAWVRKRRWFLLVVILPTLLAAIYYGLIASDVYVSESRFVIKSPDQRSSPSGSLASLIQTTGLSAGQEQANEVLAFVTSRDALRALDQQVDVRRRYGSADADLFSRFPGPLRDQSFESLYRYYGKMVDAGLDSDSGLAVITTRAFSAQDAYVVNAKLLDLSEALVNRLNARARDRGISEAQRQVDLATVRAREARVALASFRNQQALIDPAQQAAGALQISDTLIAQRAALQAQLEQMQRVAPNNPSIPSLRNRISAISGQIASQDRRVVGTDGAIASKLGGYENLLVEQEFATESLNAASAALVQARAEAQQQQFYLERVVDPNLPDMPLLPKRLLGVLVVAAAALCLYFIGWMLIVGVLEHAPDD
jgi:capsular polysaccharide transport system permease protein